VLFPNLPGGRLCRVALNNSDLRTIRPTLSENVAAAPNKIESAKLNSMMASSMFLNQFIAILVLLFSAKVISMIYKTGPMSRQGETAGRSNEFYGRPSRYLRLILLSDLVRERNAVFTPFTLPFTCILA
jgi:hypothetical protein